jgi:hypothetical protein
MATTIQVIENRLAILKLQRAVIDKEIIGLEEAARILRPIYAELPDLPALLDSEDIGITDAVRNALKNAKNLFASSHVTATQLRDLVVAQGFDMSKYNNEMAVIHQVLRRLIEAGEVASMSHPNAKMVYWWIEKPASPSPLAGIAPGLFETISKQMSGINQAAVEVGQAAAEAGMRLDEIVSGIKLPDVDPAVITRMLEKRKK